MNNFYKGLLLASLFAAGAATEAHAQKLSGRGTPAGNKIASFTSVKPDGQSETITYPTETHTFQQLAKSGTTNYTFNSAETMPGNNDFTAFVASKNNSKQGYLSINHETSPGGVSILDMHLNMATRLWEVKTVRKVDFSSLVKTQRNCSGGITPWGTVITSEETTSMGDENGDGYQDVGWQVEIDPVTAKIRDYDGDGKPDKLWAMGRMSHENIAVSSDMVTVYQAEDGGSNGVYKFIADKPGNLSEGTLYVLKLDGENATTGTWVVVPNKTKEERNNTFILGKSLGTNWRNPEDIEFGPDGKMYFTTKGSGTIWRFKDNGSTVSEVEAWVTPQQYEVKYNGGSQLENWGTGIDNLTFDGEGNLWALQDGGRNNLWVVKPDHTPEKPSLELFMTTPYGSESTGLTFSPDFKYGFISIQHPSKSNQATLKDAAGQDVQFNNDVTFVFGRKEHLGKHHGRKHSILVPAKELDVYPNPFPAYANVKVNLTEEATVKVDVYTLRGKKVATLANGTLTAGEHNFEFIPSSEEAASGNRTYIVKMQVNDEKPVSKTIIHVKQ